MRICSVEWPASELLVPPVLAVHTAVPWSHAHTGAAHTALPECPREAVPQLSSWGDFLRACQDALVVFPDRDHFRVLCAAIEDAGYLWPYTDQSLFLDELLAWFEPISVSRWHRRKETADAAALDAVLSLFQVISECPATTRSLLLARSQPGTGWHRALSVLDQQANVASRAQVGYKTISGLTFLSHTPPPARADREGGDDGMRRKPETADAPSHVAKAGESAVALLQQALCAMPGIRATERPGQQQMAHEVACALEDSHNAVIEAGTGVGKSFAYLVPAIVAAQSSDKPIVVATHTL
ncbi:MAG: hypothetical protein OWT27_00115, partial [Firmicutes bacterium]|nr:hypothetical protein [Bacillota bacterium]